MGRNAIITGASGGIGGTVAERLARDCFSVVLNYAGNAAKAEHAVTAINAAGGHGIAIKADVASPPDVEQLFKQAGDGLGAMDVVIHCAGIMPLRPIADGDVAMFDKVIRRIFAERFWCSPRRHSTWAVHNAGHMVFGPAEALRSVKRAEMVRAMLTGAGADPGRGLVFFAADLERDDGWAEAVAGCDYVMHVASPIPAAAPKTEDELIVPAARQRSVRNSPLTHRTECCTRRHSPSAWYCTSSRTAESRRQKCRRPVES
jgi:nucleoside-diphosphate-sugar epimerase